MLRRAKAFLYRSPLLYHALFRPMRRCARPLQGFAKLLAAGRRTRASSANTGITYRRVSSILEGVRYPPKTVYSATFSDGSVKRCEVTPERNFEDIDGPKQHALYQAARQWLAGRVGVADWVMDCATGTGYGAAILSEGLGCRVVGVDVNTEAVEYASRRYEQAGCEFVADDAHKLAAFTGGSITAVVSIETIEHLPDPAACIVAYHRCLCPGGLLFLSTPDATGREHSGNPFHFREFSQGEARALLAPFFVIEEAARMNGYMLVKACARSGGE